MTKPIRVRVSRTKPESMTRQITNQLSSLIQAGTLAAGDLLPSERMLADSLGVARNVVRRSYEYLSSGGQIEGRGRQGRRVSSASSKGHRKGAAATGQKSSNAKGKASSGSARGKSKSGRKAR